MKDLSLKTEGCDESSPDCGLILRWWSCCPWSISCRRRSSCNWHWRWSSLLCRWLRTSFEVQWICLNWWVKSYQPLRFRYRPGKKPYRFHYSSPKRSDFFHYRITVHTSDHVDIDEQLRHAQQLIPTRERHTRALKNAMWLKPCSLYHATNSVSPSSNPEANR